MIWLVKRFFKVENLSADSLGIFRVCSWVNFLDDLLEFYLCGIFRCKTWGSCKHMKIDFISRSYQNNLSKIEHSDTFKITVFWNSRTSYCSLCFCRPRMIKTFWKNYHSNIWMLPKFSNWIHLIPILGELIKNLLVRTAA